LERASWLPRALGAQTRAGVGIGGGMNQDARDRVHIGAI
jgi:hypothetical protein